MVLSVRMTSATVRRRLAAATIDGAGCAVIIALPYALGLFSVAPLLEAKGMFLLDHWLVLLGRHPATLASPPLWALSVWCLWQFVWTYFSAGRTPGGRLCSVQVVDRYGDPLTLERAALRAFGHMICGLSGGLGWLWALASQERRTWADLLSGSYSLHR